jgi:predicted  nucleic acid-binding Zn-ribbon protein
MAGDARGKEVLADLMEGTKKLISRLREDVDDLSTRGKFKLEIMSLKNRRARAFRDLGMRTYILVKNRKYEVPEVKGLVAEIRELDSEIQSQEKALEEYSDEVASRDSKVGGNAPGTRRSLGKTGRSGRRSGSP